MVLCCGGVKNKTLTDENVKINILEIYNTNSVVASCFNVQLRY